MRNSRISRWPAALATAGLLLVGGCSDVAQREAVSAASDFVAADAAGGCRLLAPATAEALEKAGVGCADALAEVTGKPGATATQVEVAGESAQVRFADQVVFLARFPQGWLITAAGCVREDPDPATPYECEVQP